MKLVVRSQGRFEFKIGVKRQTALLGDWLVIVIRFSEGVRRTRLQSNPLYHSCRGAFAQKLNFIPQTRE